MSRHAAMWQPATMLHPPVKRSAAAVRATFLAMSALAAALAATPFWVSCHSHSHDVVGKSTGATCPTAQTLTYANFGKSFVDTYCQRCHAAAVTGAARNGAPADHVFDDVLDIRTFAGHMDQLAGAGPDAVNRAMPPSAPVPTEQERRQLAEWLACQAP